MRHSTTTIRPHDIVPLTNDVKIKQMLCSLDNVVNDMFSFLFLGNHHVCGVPIDLLHDSIKDALSDRIEKTITMLCGMHKEIKSFQRGNDYLVLDLDGFTTNRWLTTHVLMFEQKEGPKSRIRTFLCTCDRGSLQIIFDIYGGIFDLSITIEERYNLFLLHAATVQSSFFPTFDLFKNMLLSSTGFNLLTPIFMLLCIIMDLPIFVIAEWATLLVDIICCPQGGS